HRMRKDVRIDIALGADRQRVVAQLHGSVDLAFDDEVFLAAQVPVDADGRADDGGLARTRRPASDAGVPRRARPRSLGLRPRVLPLVRALLAVIALFVPPTCRRTSIERSLTRARAGTRQKREQLICPVTRDRSAAGGCPGGLRG